jgi:alpha-tubulin suppressor-like RCC1 family protein
MACGNGHSIFLGVDVAYSLFGLGTNKHGELGLNQFAHTQRPVQVPLEALSPIGKSKLACGFTFTAILTCKILTNMK